MYFERFVWPLELAISSAAVLSLCSGVGAVSFLVTSPISERSHVTCSPVLLFDMYSAAQVLTTTVLMRLEHQEIGVPA